jgi:bifunctional DNase/RNase
VIGVRTEALSGASVALLMDPNSSRYLSLWMDPGDISDLAFAQQDAGSPRRALCGLLRGALEAADVQLVGALISSHAGGVYSARLSLSDGQQMTCSPVGAVCMALLADIELTTTAETIDELGVTSPGVAELQLDVDHSGAPMGAPATFVGGHAPASVSLEMVGVRIDQASNSPLILLRESHAKKYLSVWVGLGEATAVHWAYNGEDSPQPAIHKLLRDLLAAVGVRVLSAVISSLINGIYYAYLNLTNGKSLGATPADAICLSELAASMAAMPPWPW